MLLPTPRKPLPPSPLSSGRPRRQPGPEKATAEDSELKPSHWTAPGEGSKSAAARRELSKKENKRGKGEFLRAYPCPASLKAGGWDSKTPITRPDPCLPRPRGLAPGLGGRPRPHLPSAPGGCSGLGPPPPLPLPAAPGRAGAQGRPLHEGRQEAPPPSEPATQLSVNRKPVEGGGAAAPQLPSPPGAPPPGPGPRPPWPLPPERVPESATCPRWAAAASSAAASASEWSALEFEQGPEPSQRHLRSRPPPPSSNSRSLRHSASHRPRAAARPRSQSRGRLLKPPRRRRAPHALAPAIGPAAGTDGTCSQRPGGRAVESWARERAAGGVLAAGLARPGPGASSSSRPRRETQVQRGKAGGAVQAAVSIVSPPGTRRCLGTVGCAAALGLLGPPPRSGEAGSSRLGAALDPAWPVLARRSEKPAPSSTIGYLLCTQRVPSSFNIFRMGEGENMKNLLCIRCDARLFRKASFASLPVIPVLQVRKWRIGICSSEGKNLCLPCFLLYPCRLQECVAHR
ncbi:basic proline-rich protein-like [Diceros bicornis minor]|uniref:basic proline-rich protein-like n=1 Tax=Diceros bicornis minor TaxID=77932 RepID=UPI0026EB35A3|nr:basic proline-rich protein-like [Diceros bicornis minor]